jgi:hypothetical protein
VTSKKGREKRQGKETKRVRLDKKREESCAHNNEHDSNSVKVKKVKVVLVL